MSVVQRWRFGWVIPAVLSLLFSVGAVGPGDTSAQRPVDRRAGATAIAVLAPASTGTALGGGSRPVQRLVAHEGRGVLVLAGPVGCVVAGWRCAGRSAVWPVSPLATQVMATAGSRRWRGRAPPQGVRTTLPPA